MRITMWMRHDQLVRFNKGEKAYASTFRSHDSCFQIEVALGQIDLDSQYTKIPTNNYLVKQP